MRIIQTGKPAGQKAWRRLVDRLSVDPERVWGDELTRRVFGGPVSPRQAVERIIERVRKERDRALIYYLKELEGVRPGTHGFAATASERQTAVRRLPNSLRRAIRECAGHIRQYHLAQVPASGTAVRRPGVTLRERRLPLNRVGIYVPGGKAPLIATVLMNAIPARIAGVPEIVMATPPGPGGQLNDSLLYAAHLAGVTEIYRLGGAVAVAAFALGTPTVRRVDKIVGPGNIFVTEAKRQVLGLTGIDSLAGPSEIIVIADESAHPEVLAWDLLGQGEHGSGAVAILLTPSEPLIRLVTAAIRAIVREQPAFQPALDAVEIVRVTTIRQAVQLAEDYAPEHLSLQVKRAKSWLPAFRRCGALFVGSQTAQAMGDYTAGPNHVLPTGGTARWGSPLSVRDFLRYTSIIEYTVRGMRRESAGAIAVAEAEGLRAHAASIRIRVGPGKNGGFKRGG